MKNKKVEKIKLPKKVKIGGIQYNVLFPYNHIESDTLGLHGSYQSIIKVANITDNCKLSNSKILEVFIHENLHAVDFIYTNNLIEEDVIEVLARAWLQILQDNELFFYENKIPKQIRIGCFNYKVVFPYSFIDSTTSTLMKTSTTELTIRLSNNDGVSENSNDFNKVCLINAIQIAISNVYFCYPSENNNILNDSIFQMRETSFAQGLYQLFKDNKIDKLVNKYIDR